jgi:hypothetical protein
VRRCGSAAGGSRSGTTHVTGLFFEGGCNIPSPASSARPCSPAGCSGAASFVISLHDGKCHGGDRPAPLTDLGHLLRVSDGIACKPWRQDLLEPGPEPVHRLLIVDLEIKSVYRSRGVQVVGPAVYAASKRGDFVKRLPREARPLVEVLYEELDGLVSLQRPSIQAY